MSRTGRMSVYVCERGGVKVCTLSRTAHTHIHIYIFTYTQVVCVCRGGEGGVIDVVSPENEWETPHCLMYECASGHIYEFVCELLNYSVVLGHRNWQIETAGWNWAGFFTEGSETRWQRFRQFLNNL